MKMILKLKEFQSKLPLPSTEKWPKGLWDIEIFRKNGLSVSLFAPKEFDYQTPHDQDELYLIQSGTGIIAIDEKLFEFSTGDVIFVEAGCEHRFTKFTDDLTAWVIFFGEKIKQVTPPMQNSAD